MEESGRILFLCSGNYYRSRFAEMLFNARAAATGLNWRAESRGLSIEEGSRVNVGPISRHAVAGLRERGIAVPGEPRGPLPACEADFKGCQIVVALKAMEHRPMMEAYFPHWAQHIRYWDIHDVDLCHPSEALPQIERLVDGLICELKAGSGKQRHLGVSP